MTGCLSHLTPDTPYMVYFRLCKPIQRIYVIYDLLHLLVTTLASAILVVRVLLRVPLHDLFGLSQNCYDVGAVVLL